MKFILSLSGIILILSSLSTTTLLTSCTKDQTIFDTVTVTKTDTLSVIKTDTLLIKDSSFSKALLIAYPWKTTELRAVWGGDSIYYYRGGTNNTTGFGDRSIETYTFNADGTGSLLDGNNSLHPITNWQFANSDSTKLTFLVSDPPSSKTFLITWENIRYKGGSIFTDEYYHDNYVYKYYHGQAIRYQMK
jgi:hypothetical protein